jgi:hypothetical protein
MIESPPTVMFIALGMPDTSLQNTVGRKENAKRHTLALFNVVFFDFCR